MTAPDAPTTVRGVLRAALAEHQPGDLDAAVDEIVRDLARVLSTGPGWTTQPVPADQLAAGDVIAAKDGRLWAVEWVQEVGRPRDEIATHLRRGERESTKHFAPDAGVSTLLSRTDERAIRLLGEQLGCQVIGRAVA